MSINFTKLTLFRSQRFAKTGPPRRDSLPYVIRLLNRFVLGQRQVFVLALLMLVIEAVTSIYEAYPLTYLIDYLQGNRDDLLTHWGLPAVGSPQFITVAVLTTASILMAMVNSLGDSLAEIYLARGGRALGYNLRLALYRHLQRLSLTFHDQRRTGDVLTRLTGDVSEIEDFVIGSLSDIAGSLLVLIGTMTFLVYHSWQVALIAAVIIPIMALVSNFFAQRIKIAAKKQRACAGNLASATQEMLTSIRVIQTYGRGGHELKRFAEVNQQSAEVALQTAGLQARFSWVVKVLEAVAIAAVVWLGLWLMKRTSGAPTISTGMLVMFIFLIKEMFKPTRKIIKEWNTIGKIYASVERIGELLDRKPAVADAPNARQAPSFRGHIEFRQVSFAYQQEKADDAGLQTPDAAEEVRQTLTDVSFAVAPGEVLALVGYTGAGKSTIIQLLPRLYDPTAGHILIDNEDIRTFTLESLRSQVGVVLQETILFTGTVADNIAYGCDNATREMIMQAAIQANAHEFIEKLPEGYDTLLGERGANLSGGQRQRIAIARAFIRNAPILILDEPTTGLDAQSTELVQLALRMLMKGKTTIIISHDFKLVRQATQIIVLKEGRIEQMGTHRELLKTQGTYSNLYIKQFGQPKLEEEHLEGSLYDLMRSPVFQHRWPMVRTAFDAETMRTKLQSALFAPTGEAQGNADDYTIVYCKPGKATFLGEEGCRLRYELQLEHSVSGQTLPCLVLARIFSDQAAAEGYLHKRLMPLVAKLQGRPEIAPFAQPVALLAELNMVVSLFPIDGELPALLPATDCQQMATVFRETLPEDSDTPFEVEACSVEPGHYGRQHRCVLRYEVAGRWLKTGQRGHHVVYGKVSADDRSKLVCIVLTSLHKRMHNIKSSRQFLLPQIVGYRPNQRLILLEAIPGLPRVAELMQARMEGGAESNASALTLEVALKDCAHIAAALHKTGITIGTPRTFRDEVAALQEQLPLVQEFSLALAMQLQNAIQRLEAYAAQVEPLPLCFSHGDYTYTQLLFADLSCGLVDFDTSCQAEPALDLGQFLAYVRLAARKSAVKRQQASERPGTSEAEELAVDKLCTQFLNNYLRAAGYHGASAEQLRARVPAYEIISLMRIALHSWQKLKGSRLELVVELLEERIACLAKINHKANARHPQPGKQKKVLRLRTNKTGSRHPLGLSRP